LQSRIPGARSLHVERLVAEDGTLLPPDGLREAFREAGLRDGDEAIAYCRLGHRASLGWFVLREVLGHDRVRVYDGSWTEWGIMVGMPVEREGAS
jgi:thiosulfate/3-mercaptopyruvate sulfurtransferase